MALKFRPLRVHGALGLLGALDLCPQVRVHGTAWYMLASGLRVSTQMRAKVVPWIYDNKA